MKEKNKVKKLELKKQRLQILLRKQLHHDIANFMVEISAALCTNPYELLNKLLIGGFKGYDRMRGKDLIKLFDKYHAMLRNAETPLPIHYQVKTTGQQKISFWSNVRGSDVKTAYAELLFKSDALMSRLLEIAFDLDFDE